MNAESGEMQGANNMSGEQSNRDQTVFSVRLDGLDLPSDVTSRIGAAIRRAVLVELADVDLRGGVRLQNDGGGGTQGIQIIADVENPRAELGG
jgi:hypothetical protein